MCLTSCACLTNPCSWFGRPYGSSGSEAHDYIYSVLERGDHGRNRHIDCDRATLNDAIQQHAERIAQTIEAEAKEAVAAARGTHQVTLENKSGTVSFKCDGSFNANNLDDIVQKMAEAKRKNLNVKAINGFYAFSPICETSGYAIRTDKLVGITPTPTTSLKKPSPEGLYDVLCGTSYTQAIAALEKDGRAVDNLPGFIGLGVLGSTATGTHGSGLTVPPLADSIVGINLISAQFDESGHPIQYRIEPKNGITDPKLHRPPWVLIQDDGDFNATRTGLGAMGVIYSVTITTVPFYWVKEHRQVVDWPTARKMLGQGPQGDILKYHNSEVWINPYTSLTLLSLRETTTTRPTCELAGAASNIFATLVVELPGLNAVISRIFGNFDPAEVVGHVLALFLRHFPRFVPTALDLALRGQMFGVPSVAKYYDIYDIGFPHNFPGFASEISYPMTSYIAAADSTISVMKNLSKQDMYKATVAPISLRFSASSSTNLSMAYSVNSSQSLGRNYIEILSLIPFYKPIQTYYDIVTAISEQTISKYKGRWHWGQIMASSFTTRQYQSDPDYIASIALYKAVAEKYDPGRMMANRFLREVIWLETV